jgi:hypothetical protein
MSVKHFNDIGNRTGDLSACSTVPEATAPPGAPHTFSTDIAINTEGLY